MHLANSEIHEARISSGILLHLDTSNNPVVGTDGTAIHRLLINTVTGLMAECNLLQHHSTRIQCPYAC